MSLIDIVILIIEIGVGMCCNQNNQILQPWVELEKTHPGESPGQSSKSSATQGQHGCFHFTGGSPKSSMFIGFSIVNMFFSPTMLKHPPVTMETAIEKPRSSIKSPHRMACSCNWDKPGSMKPCGGIQSQSVRTGAMGAQT